MLLKTKLYFPQPRPDFISRPRLLQQLDDGLQTKLTVVRAPAGYGKTTLVTDWISQRDIPIGWLSLDSADSDPTTFAKYLIAAAQQIQPTCCAEINTPSVTLNDILPVFINDLFELEADSLLVLDDYHLIQNDDVHQAVAYLLDNMPPRLHLLMTTRSVPALGLLPRLRVRGEMVEVDAAALRFTDDEAAQFLSSMRLSLTPEQVSLLGSRTEGWIAGLQLVAVSMQGRSDTDGFIEALSGRHQYIVDYLVEEALGQSSAELQQFLLDTCILKRFNASLCDAVRECEDSQQRLEELKRKNLFLIPLDNERHWFRYHHIFDQFLNGQLAKTAPHRTAELHHRAAGWFIEAGDARTATDHFLSAQAYAEAAELIANLMPQVVAGGEVDVIKRWLAQLPPNVFAATPVLLAMRALIDVRAGEWRSAQQDVARLQAMDNLDPSIAGIVTLTASEIAMMQDDIPSAIELAERALQQFEPSSMKLHTANRLLNLYLLSGDLTEMRRIQAEIEPTVSPTLEDELHQLLLQAEMAFAVGLLHDAARLQQQGLQKARLANVMPLPIVGALQVGLGRVRFEWGDLDEAESLLVKGLETLMATLFHNQRISGTLSLYSVKRLQGDMAQAAKQLAQAGTLLRRFNVAKANAVMDAHEAQFALYQGDLQQATRWLRACGLSIEGENVQHHTMEYLVVANVLSAHGEMAQALPLLQQIEAVCREAQLRSRLVQALVAQAAVQLLAGNGEAAIAAMREGVKSAEPENIVRPFLEHAEPAKLLLQEIRQHKLDGFLSDFVDDLLGALGVDLDTATRSHQSAITQPIKPLRPASDAADTVPLLDPLTEREMDVLGYLAQGLSNQAIADAMFVAVSTTRTHLSNLYSKLDARSRTHAVMRARELNLIG